MLERAIPLVLNCQHNEAPSASQDRCEASGSNHVGEDGRQHEADSGQRKVVEGWRPATQAGADARSSLGRLSALPDTLARQAGRIARIPSLAEFLSPKPNR